MRHDLIVSRAIIINAGIGQVWEALTNPEIIKQYLYGTETITDWKVGNEIIFQGEYQGIKYKDHGIILENIINSKLSYSYWTSFSGLEDIPGNYSTITCILIDLAKNQTELNWIQQGFANEEGQQHSKNGMDTFLSSIKIIVEKSSATN